MIGVGLTVTLAGCAHAGQGVKSTAAASRAYDTIPVEAAGYVPGAIEIGDRVSLRVFGEPDLTSDNYTVDGQGVLQVPLVGEIKAAGRTTHDVGGEITQRLAAHYIREPQVALAVVEHATDNVTVEGEVQKAGRFSAGSGLTLLGAIALAQSPTLTAKLDEIYVFRVIDGRQAGARFNLTDIRKGRAPDPQIVAGDVVVVGHSAVRQAFRDLLSTAPFFNLFYIFK